MVRGAGGVSVYEINGNEYVAVAIGNDSKTVWSTTGAATVSAFGLRCYERSQNRWD